MKQLHLTHTLVIATIILLSCSCSKTINNCKIEPATDCRGASLAGADLSGAFLSAADLTDVDFRNANLSGADLNWANLRGADLRGADLKGATLSSALLNKAQYNTKTQWPEGFDPEAAHAVLVDDGG